MHWLPNHFILILHIIHLVILSSNCTSISLLFQHLKSISSIFYTASRRCPANLFRLCLIECGEEITGYANDYNNSYSNNDKNNNNNNGNNNNNNNNDNHYDNNNNRDNNNHSNRNDFNYITDITGKKIPRYRNINFTIICH